MKKLYKIIVYGCHNETDIVCELSDAEADTIIKIADKINDTSNHKCMPRMFVHELNHLETTCKKCGGTGYVPLGPGIRGIETCDICYGTGMIGGKNYD